MRCAMYIRRSRADVEAEKMGQGATLSRHFDTLMALAKKMKIVIADKDIYREIVSGDTISARPEMQRLLRAVEAGIYGAILCVDVDRLARGDSIDQGIIMQTIAYSGTKIITPYKTYDPADPSDEEFFELKLFFARREYAQIKRRMQTGRISSVLAGLYIGSKPPYGYKRKKLENEKGWMLEIAPEEAAVVRQIFEWYLRGENGEELGCSKIAARLTEMGIRPREKSKWGAETILQMLKNPVYTGKVTWGRHSTETEIKNGERKRVNRYNGQQIICDGRHEAIISEKMFESVQQEILQNRKCRNPRRVPLVNPLAGIVVCGMCGASLHMQRNKYTSDHDLLMCPNQYCESSGAYLKSVESAILETLKQWVNEIDAERIEAQPEDVHESDGMRAALEKELETIGNQLNRLRDLLEQGVYSPVTYLEREQILTERAEAAKVALAALENKNPPMNEAIRMQAPKIRDVLKSVIEKVVYIKSEKCGRVKELGQKMQLEIYPKVPKN